MSEYKFLLPIGDWSKDGHNQCDWYTVSSNKPMKAVFAAYHKAAKKFTDCNPGDFCCDYEDNKIDLETRNLLTKEGLVMFSDDDGDGDHWVDSEQFAEIVIWFIQKGDPDLKLSIIQDKEMPRFINWEDPKKNLPNFGYGLFY